MDYPQSRYPLTVPCKMESFEPFDHRISTHQAEILDHRCRPPKNELEDDHASTAMDIETNDVERMTIRMKYFRLSDEEAVCEYLHDRLLLLQQQAGKRIAKAWIKGICPKKQARFPYRSKQQKIGQDPDPNIPEWWPIGLCEFTEPDHVDKQSRMNLCLPLLRLRPSLQELKKWNKDLQGPNKTLETRGWTAFLQELTPSTTLDGLGKSPESEERVKQRQKIMDDMYDVAEKEETFRKGERDDDLIYYDDQYDSTLSIKKSHIKKRPSDARESKSSDITDQRQKERKQSATLEPQKKKRRPGRRSRISMGETRVRTRPGSSFLHKYPEQMDQLHRAKTRCKLLQPSMRLIPTMGSLPIKQAPGLISHSPRIDQWTSSQESSPLTASFSSQDDMRGSIQIWDGPTNFPGQRDFKFDGSAHQESAIYVHNADFPHPYFETVPNTPVISPTKCTSFPQCSAWAGEYHIAPVTDRYPGLLSTTYMPANPAPIQASQPHMLPSDMPYAPGPFMEQPQKDNRLPITPTSDAQEDIPSMAYGEQQHHGLPISYRHNHSTPDENGPSMTFAYPEPTPDANFPAAALPGSVVRGYTGTSSGVGDGAWV